MASFKSKYVITLLCIPFILVGISMCFEGLGNIRNAERTEHWETAPGVIAYSKISEQGSKPSYTSSGKQIGNNNRIYKPIIKYNYIVKSIQYQSNTIYLGDDQAPNVVSYADTVVSQYPVKQKIMVRYDPANPQFSVLKTGTSEVTFKPLVIGLIFVVAGICMQLWFWVFSRWS
jgi:Protein of unknown function (DUF3592)